MKKANGVAGKRLKKISSKLLRIAAWTTGGVLVLLIVLIALIRVPSVQNRLVRYATDYLQERIGTPVSIGSILVSFPKRIVIEDIYLEDQQGDTLLYAQHFELNTRLVALLRRQIAIQDIRLETAKVYVSREKGDSTFNYTYIVKAFTEGDIDSVKIEEDDAKAWAISLDNVHLGKAFVDYRDHLEGNEFIGRIGELDVKARETNLVDNIYRLRKISLTNADLSIAISARSPVDTVASQPVDASIDTTRLPYTTGLDELKLENVSFRYESPSQNAIIDVGLLEVNVREFDMTSQVARLSSIVIENTRASYFIDEAVPDPEVQEKDTVGFEISPWAIAVDKLSVGGSTIQYFNLTDTVRTPGFNPARIWISALNVEARAIKADRYSAGLNLEKLNFKERSGLSIRSLEGFVAVSDKLIDIKGLHAGFNRSDLRLDARAEYASFAELMSDPGKTQFDIEISPSKVYATDLMLISPSLLDSLPVTLQANDRISFAGSANGRINDLHLRDIRIDALDSTRIRLSGDIRGLPAIESSSFNVKLSELRSTRTDLQRLAVTLPSGIVVPQWMKLQGVVSGTYYMPRLDATLTSSDGMVSAKGDLDFRGEGLYKLSVEAKDLHLGHLLADEELGPISLKARVDGTGKSPDTFDAKVNLLLSGLTYKEYNYKDLKLDGRFERKLFSGDVVMDDENLDFALKADLDYGKEIPTYVFTLDLRNIDMKALHLTERPLRARATLDVDLATADFVVLNGHVDLRKVAVFNGTKLYAIDSMLMASIDQEGESSIEIRSDIMTGDFKGTINIFGLPAALRQHVDSYFSLNDSTVEQPQSLQAFEFDLILKNTDLLTEVLFPPLEPFTPGKVHGTFNSEERNLDIVVRLANLKYDDLSIDSVSLIMDSDPKALNFGLALKQIRYDTLNIHDFDFSARAANDSLRSSLSVLDSLKKANYFVGALLSRRAHDLQLHLIPGEVMLNGSKWDVPQKNILRFGIEGMQAEQFGISKGNQEVTLKTSTKDSLVNITFKELELGNITRIISGAVPASGELNGEFKFSSSNSGQFSSRLDITSLSVLHKPWGDLNLTMHHTNGRYVFTVNLRGNQTTVKASGDYAMVNDVSVITLATDITSLNLELIEPFTGGQARKMEGIVEGKVKVSGTPAALDIRGDVRFRNATFEAIYLNSMFAIEDELISFREEGVVFDDFEIHDGQGNPATIRGRIATRHYRDFDLELDLSARNFQVLNTPPSARLPVFGLVKLDLDAAVRGPSTNPVVTMKIGLSDDSNVTYTIPPSDVGIIEQRGIVVFVDKDAMNDPFLREVKPTETSTEGFRGLDLNATIDLRDRETLNIIIDPETGDKLTVRGNASLTLDIDPSGNLNLSGRYEISEGQYNLSFYKLVKRKFEIVRGSVITWSGDPLRGVLDIRALYTVDASPVELVAGQSADDTDLNPFRQRLPFLVYLNIDGELMVPEISFYLDMPQDKRNVHGGVIYARILDIDSKEAELNKQVFGLLILRTFVADNPLEGSSGGDLKNSARISASRMLSEQLNRLSSRIKGVELSVNVKSFEDYTTGQAQGHTQAELGVSKTLFGDRLVVKLTGNVDIEGETEQTNVTDYIGDIALEYKMTTDGRIRLTGFRNSNYDMIDGELIETGAGVIYIKDYNALRELFKANDKEAN